MDELVLRETGSTGLSLYFDTVIAFSFVFRCTFLCGYDKIQQNI